jgi:hypothetical protein
MKSNFYFFNKYRKCFINVILVFTTMIMFCQEIYIYTCIHCRFFIVCLYMFCYWRSSYQEGREAIPLIGLIQVHICACLKPGPGFLTSYVMVCFVFSELRWEVIVRYVAIGGIVDHHCLIFLFIIYLIQKGGVHVSLTAYWCVHI